MTANLAVVLEQVKSGGAITEQVPGMLAFVDQQKEAAVLQECKAQASAIVEYLAQRRDVSIEEHNAAVKIKLKVEHRLGEVLRETVKAGNPQLNCDTVSQLPDEITRKQSSRAQQVASIPWEAIEEKIDAATNSEPEPAKAVQSRIISELKEERKPPESVPKEESPPPAPKGKPAPRYPRSDQLVKWLDWLAGETFVINVEQGGIKGLLAVRDEWDRREVKEFILPQLKDLADTINEFYQEIHHAFE